jgi:hypothetical protein
MLGVEKDNALLSAASSALHDIPDPSFCGPF